MAAVLGNTLEQRQQQEVKPDNDHRGCTFSMKSGMLNIAAQDFPVRGNSWKRAAGGGVVWMEGRGANIDKEGTGHPFGMAFKHDRIPVRLEGHTKRIPGVACIISLRFPQHRIRPITSMPG